MESKTENTKKAPCLAVFGTGSDVGKSIVASALCRFFLKRGIRVAPYKAQNMSNNSGVTSEGLEMGRAQIVQAEAAGIAPQVDMNPILLKPTSEIGSQVILLGEALSNSTAKQYHTQKTGLFQAACDALDRLRNAYDLVIIEGAGSCAEVNLMPHDIVNFKIAEYADAKVILVADIHRGGVFAQIIGTLQCLSEKQRNQIIGCIVNRFRGDISLFDEGVGWIEEKTEKKVFGVLPWYHHIKIEAEDSVVIENPSTVVDKNSTLPVIAVIRIPHISNFTDFEPLADLDGVVLQYVEKVQDLRRFAAVILPGSKNTRFDLNWLKTTGWAQKIAAYSNQKGHVLGICGGYQMMGHYVHDPQGLEGKPGTTKGLGLLPVETFLRAPKTTTLTRFTWQEFQGTGYEIHMGQTIREEGAPVFRILDRNAIPSKDEDGCIANHGRAMGTYIHGLFDTPGVTKKWFKSIGLEHIQVSDIHGLTARNREYDLLSEHFEKYIDTQAIVENLEPM